LRLSALLPSIDKSYYLSIPVNFPVLSPPLLPIVAFGYLRLYYSIVPFCLPPYFPSVLHRVESLPRVASRALLCSVFRIGTTKYSLKNDNNMEEKRQLIPTAEAAAFLGIKVSYLHKLMMRRVIPYYKPNGKLCFFDKAELEAWMKNVRIASQTELDRQAQAYIVNRAKGGKP
jgi:putative excisionase